MASAIILVLALVLLSAKANASIKLEPHLCFAETEALDELAIIFGEEPYADLDFGEPGTKAYGKGVILYNSKTGSWRLVIEGPNGTLCTVISGHKFGPSKRRIGKPT